MRMVGVWVDVGRLLAQKECWEKCMALDIVSQDDIGCKLRLHSYVFIIDLDADQCMII